MSTIKSGVSAVAVARIGGGMSMKAVRLASVILIGLFLCGLSVGEETKPRKMSLPECRALVADKEQNVQVRIVAVATLGAYVETAHEEVLGIALAALRDRNTGMRQAAAYVLSDLKDARSVEPIVAALKDDKDLEAYVGFFAIYSLPNEPWRSSLINVFRVIGKDAVKAVPFLIEYLKSDESGTGHAALALGQIGDQRAVQPLMEVLADKKASSFERGSAATALGCLRSDKSFDLLKGIASDTAQKDSAVRKAAIAAVGKYGTDEAAKVILGVLRRKQLDWLLLSAVKAAGDMQLKAALNEFNRLAEDPMLYTVRGLSACIAMNLGKFTDSPAKVVPILRKLTSNRDSTGAAVALAVAARMGKEGKVLIVESLQHRDAFVRYTAVRETGNLKSADAIPALQRILNNEKEQEYVKKEARKALKKISK